MITIPLQGGAANAHQTFNIQLGDFYLTFVLNYITEEGPAWSVDIYDEGDLLIAGAMLEPNGSLVENHRLDIGNLVFVGADVTLDNLGIDNKLVWIAPNEQV